MSACISINKTLAALRVLYILVAFYFTPIDNVSLTISLAICPRVSLFRGERERGISFILVYYVILI